MRKRTNPKLSRYATTAAAIAAVAAAIYPAYGEQTGDAVTISLSGSTAMRNFTTSAGFTYLNPGTSITLNSGISGAPLIYTAPTGNQTQVQLAQGNFTDPEDTVFDPGNADFTLSYKALRVEW